MSKGRNVSTNKIGGYLLLSTLARLKRWRRGTYRFVQQHSMLSDWQARIQDVAPVDYDYALALASCIEIVRGYGETWERGHSRFTRSLAAVEHVSDEPAVVVNSLHRAALEDENGEKFDNLIAKYEAT